MAMHPPYRVPFINPDGTVNKAWATWIDSLSSKSDSLPTSTVHNDLSGRDATATHPVTAITGLSTTISSINSAISSLQTEVGNIDGMDTKVALNGGDAFAGYLVDKLGAGVGIGLGIAGGKLVVSSTGHYQPYAEVLNAITNLEPAAGVLTNDGNDNFSYTPPSGGGNIDGGDADEHFYGTTPVDGGGAA